MINPKYKKLYIPGHDYYFRKKIILGAGISDNMQHNVQELFFQAGLRYNILLGIHYKIIGLIGPATT